MDKIQRFQCVAAEEKIQEHQVAIDDKGYRRFFTGIAGVVMLFVFCPMSIVAISCPYWKLSSEVQNHSMNATASLWDVSTSTKIREVSMDSELKMCGDEMQGFDECGKIYAIRLFVITASLLSLASAVCFLAVFFDSFREKCTAPCGPSKCTAATQEKVTIAGICLASVVLLWSFLGTCIAASVNMQEGYSLTGVGFLFLVLQMFCCSFVLALKCSRVQKSTSSSATEEVHIGTKQQPQAANYAPPNLLSNARKAWDKDLEKGDIKEVVAAAAVVVGAAEKTSSEC